MPIIDFSDANANLATFFHERELDFEPDSIAQITNNDERLEFVGLFNDLQRKRKVCFEQPALNGFLMDLAERGYTSNVHPVFVAAYLDLVEVMQADPVLVNSNVDFGLDLYASDIDVTYVFNAVVDKSKSVTKLIKLVGSSSNLLKERKELIAFLYSLSCRVAHTVKSLVSGYERFKTTEHPMATNIVNKFGITADRLNLLMCYAVESNSIDSRLFDSFFDADELGYDGKAEQEKLLMTDLLELIKLRMGVERFDNEFKIERSWFNLD